MRIVNTYKRATLHAGMFVLWVAINPFNKATIQGRLACLRVGFGQLRQLFYRSA